MNLLPKGLRLFLRLPEAGQKREVVRGRAKQKALFPRQFIDRLRRQFHASLFGFEQADESYYPLCDSAADDCFTDMQLGKLTQNRGQLVAHILFD